jgi:hypothetical protein
MRWTRFSALMVMAGCAAAQDSTPPYKFSTTVTDEGLYTFGTTTVANSGFRGDIYLLRPQTAKLPNFSKLKSVGSIYTAYLCVPRRSFDEGFPGITDRFEWFAIDYNGRFWISQPGRYEFALVSDDGSKLYIDGKKTIDNDGIHAELKAFGGVKLNAGVHDIRVSYFQGPRFHVSLILGVKGPDDPEFRVFHTDDFKPPADVSAEQLAEKPGKKK